MGFFLYSIHFLVYNDPIKMKKPSKTFRFLTLLSFILAGSLLLLPDFYTEQLTSGHKNDNCFSFNIEIEESVPEKEEVIELTNLMRAQHDLPPLVENDKLSEAARIKAVDMIENEYFAHDSPTGRNVKDLAEMVDYHFLTVGENLAKGNFKNSFNLVDGWMNSIDHRRNILEKNYEEIGVAVKRGVYNGYEIWMAVQIFGTEFGICPEPDKDLIAKIDRNNERLDLILTQIDDFDIQIEEANTEEDYNELIRMRNVLVDRYNQIRDDLELLISEYNQQIKEREVCVNEYR